MPDLNFHGADAFTYKANDGTADSNIATVSITVNPVNDAPMLETINSKSVDELVELTFTANASDIDIPADTLTFSLVDGTSGLVPLGASITAGGVFTWTPSEAQGPDLYTFDVCVSDGFLIDCETITVTVNEVNVAPVLNEIGSKSVDELAELTFNAIATDADLPANTLTLSLADGTSGLVPSGASITAGGEFSWTPTEAQGYGQFTFDVCVSDGLESDCESIIATVNEVNVAPVLNTIGSKSVNELVLLTFNATASDADFPANTLTYSLENGTSGLVPSGASITTGGVFTWTPTEAQGYGLYTFDICVSDTLASDCETITVTVNEVNVAPELGSIGNKSVDELVELTFIATAGDADLPINLLTFFLDNGTEGLVPTGASLTTDGHFTWTPTEAQGPDLYTLDVCVSDGLLSDCETITVTVNEVNVAPVLGEIGSQSVDELAVLTFNGTAIDADIPAQSLTFSLISAPAGASITSGGAFTWTPTEEQGPDSYSFDVCVSDGLLSDCETITVTVNEVNVAPVLGEIGSKSVNELDLLTINATATDADFPENTLTYSLENGTSGLVPSGASITTGGVFTWTPTEAQGPGSFIFDVCVSDSQANHCETITVSVNEVNVAPVLNAIDSKSVDELVELTFNATASDVDFPAQSLSFSLSGAPTGASITTDGVFTWTPTEVQGPDEYTFDVCVSDGILSDCEPITVTVNEVNVAPSLVDIGSKTVNEMVQLTFTATATDPDQPANTLTYTLTNGLSGLVPSGASITTGGIFTWTPTETQGYGLYTFDVCVSDGSLTDCETITVTVNEVNLSPVLGAIGNKSVNEQTLLTFTATATDPDLPANPLAFALANGLSGLVPSGANITPGGVFNWTPTEEHGPGSYTFDVCVSDSALTDCETITITVDEVNVAPVLGAIGSKSVNELVLLTFTATATDADIPVQSLFFSLTGAPDGASITSGGVFSWTPTEDQGPDDYSFDVCVSDGSLNDCETVTVTVNEVNISPELGSIGSKSVNELVELTFTATATDADLPANTLTFSLVNGSFGSVPAGAGITTGGVFTWTPTEEQGPGSFTFDVCVSDGLASDCETISVNVDDINSAPYMDLIGSKTIDELLELTFTAQAYDTDIPLNILTFSLVFEPAGAVIDPSSGVFSWTPTEAQGPGSYPFDLCVSDGVIKYCETITVIVYDINSSPILDPIGEKTVVELTLLTFTATGSDTDIPVNSLTFNLKNAPTGAAINPTTGVFTWTPDATQPPGLYPFEICINDGALEDCESIVVRVKAFVNTPPVCSAVSLTADEDIWGQADPTCTDVDLDPLTYSIVDQPSHGTAEVIGGKLRYLSATDYYGSDSFTYKSNDGTDDSNSSTVTVSVNPVNDAPVCSTVSITTNKNTLGTATPNCSDIENDPLTYQIASQPANGSALVLGSQLIYTPEANFYGVDSFTYTASDGDLESLAADVTVTVNDVSVDNQAPSVPNLLSPASNALIYDLTPRLDWSNSTVPTGITFKQYEIQIAEDSGFTTIVLDAAIEGISNSEFTPQEGDKLSPNKTYYWRVRAFNTLGQFSNWSAVRYFREAIAVPLLISPEELVKVSGLRPQFDWLDVDGATSYTIQVSKYSNLSSPIINTKTLDSFYVPTKDLTKNKILYWRVRANNADGSSVWSEVRSFVSPNPPSTPVLASPAKNALLMNLTPRLDWKDVTLPIGTTLDHYQIQVAKEIDFVQPVIDLDISSISEYTPTSPLEPNTLYYWRVRAFNSIQEYTSWSTVFYFREAMLPPTLLSPAHKSDADNLRPEFSWQAVEGAVSYTIQITDYPTLILPTVNTTVTETTYIPIKDLPRNAPLYWRVRANGANGPSDWSTVWTVNSPNTPSVPVLVSPANNALLFDRKPKLDWKDVIVPGGANFGYYILQVSNDRNFTAASVIEKKITEQFPSEYIFDTDLQFNTLYYWRVKVYNTQDHYSSWSLVRSFREAMLPPILSSPANGATPDNLQPKFDWEDVEGATSYTIQMSLNSNMSSPFLTKSATTSLYNPTADLKANKTIYWRVRANGPNGPSQWSVVWNIQTPNPPSRPSLLSPANAALIMDRQPILDWSTSTVPSGTTFSHYQLQISTDSLFLTIIDQVDITNILLSDHKTVELSPNTVYYWRVRAFNTNGQYRSWTPARYFREAMLPPDLLTPSNQETLSTVRPFFDWGDVEGADSYTIQVSKYANMKYPMVKKNVIGSDFLTTTNLPTNLTLYWWVRANGPNGPSPWSEIRTLRIALP
jgi:hypothetical protein